MTIGQSRRLVVGAGPDERSRVVRDDRPQCVVVRPSGAIVEEVWRVSSLPADAAAGEAPVGEMAPLPELGGITIRRFVVPPGTGVSKRPEMAPSSLLNLLTVVEGAAILVLDTEDVPLSPGDFVVLPGSRHGWQNPFDSDCVIVTTVARLAGGDE